LKPCPVVLVIAGHDPSGGAGIQADIETLGALGCHATTAITALTVQDTCGVSSFEPVTPALLKAQALAILQDMPVTAIKLGMLGSPAAIGVVEGLMDAFPGIPVVLDPVLAGGGGGSLSREGMALALRDRLIGRVTLATPNGPELLALAPGASSPAEAAAMLSIIGEGRTAVLATGGHETGSHVVNTLWCRGVSTDQQAWERLGHEFHGSGCTLASACAAFLAHGHELADSVRRAQHFTWHSLQAARALGRGQRIPRRLRQTMAATPSDTDGSDA
jgi:hydroxymethylpyrimidine/phosphomethylpyrimidine kinase